ncbi:uncharacterized protein METZ01_LOCUS138573, partial [marine metagenome]
NQWYYMRVMIWLLVLQKRLQSEVCCPMKLIPMILMRGRLKYGKR